MGKNRNNNSNKKAKKEGANRWAGVRKQSTKPVLTNLKKMKFQNEEQREAVDSCLQEVVQAAIKEKAEKKATEAQAPKNKLRSQKLPPPDMDMAAEEFAKL